MKNIKHVHSYGTCSNSYKTQNRYFLKMDGTDNSPKEMRFLAKMVSDNPDNKDREFSIIFSLIDDDIKVWENQTDGFVKGFVYKSPYTKEKKGKPDFSQMFIGSHPIINGVTYDLYDAPEITFQIMEQHTKEFPFMDVNLITEKLRKYSKQLREEFKKVLIPETDRVRLEDARKILTNCEANLNPNEVIALVRKFRFYKTQTYSFHELLAFIG